ncbi:MAG: pirin family protein [Fidelibacterota bacterium]
MIQIYPAKQLGQTDYGWLKARYHFSFARYIDRNKMGVPPLRVWNDDRIQPQSGFPLHSHRNMEIITYVLDGAITHEDNLGNKGRIAAGQVQVMSAGSGIMHSEYNREPDVTHLFQIWLEPNRDNISPRWETISLPDDDNTTILIVSGRQLHREEKMIRLNQDAALYVLRAGKNHVASLPDMSDRQGYGVVSRGRFAFRKFLLHPGDGFYISGEAEFSLKGRVDTSEMVFVDLPPK